MKKTVLAVSLVLLLLVSCATKKNVEPEPEPEVVQATVVEQFDPVEEPSSAVSEEVVNVPTEEVAESTQLIPDEEVIEEQPASEEVVFDSPEEPAPTQEETLPESDWGHVFTKDDQGEVTASEPEAVSQPSEASISSPQKEVVTTTAAAPAVQESPVQEKEPSVFDRIVLFISHEILFSIGLLVCAVGVIYFIVALVRSSSRRSKRSSRKMEKTSSEPAEKKSEEQSDAELADEDDEFLKALLRDGKK